MVTFTKCKADGSGCVTFYQEQPQQRIAKIQPVRKFDPAVLVELRGIRDSLIAIKKELPAYLQKQQMQAIMKDPARLAKISTGEIEEMFPRESVDELGAFPSQLNKSQIESLMKDPVRLANLTPPEIEAAFPREEE